MQAIKTVREKKETKYTNTVQIETMIIYTYEKRDLLKNECTEGEEETSGVEVSVDCVGVVGV